MRILDVDARHIRQTHTLSKAWAEFERRLLDPINAPQEQRVEMRRAFYAGAQTIFHFLVDGVDANMDDPTAEEVEYVARLDAELKAFNTKVLNGLA